MALINLLILFLDILVLEIVNWYSTAKNEDLALLPPSAFLIHVLSLPSHLPASSYNHVLF